MDASLGLFVLFGGAAASLAFLGWGFYSIWRDDRRRPYFEKLIARRNVINWKIKKLEDERAEVERSMEIFKPKEGAKKESN